MRRRSTGLVKIWGIIPSLTTNPVGVKRFKWIRLLKHALPGAAAQKESTHTYKITLGAQSSVKGGAKVMTHQGLA